MDNGEWTEGESTDDEGVRGGWVRKKDEQEGRRRERGRRKVREGGEGERVKGKMDKKRGWTRNIPVRPKYFKE